MKATEMREPIQKELLKTLEKIDRPGTFCTNGLLPATLPGLEVQGLGPVSLPLGKGQATVLKKHARQAPYGKGTETLVDTDVRNVWEIDADEIVLANPEWNATLAEAVTAVQSELGLEDQKLEAHLYKLLLYEPGSFFLSHRDGEKLDRMVATLVVTLPSAHRGGELIVRHEGREVTVDFGPKSPFQTQFAAFYSDCEHEIRPVTSGYRLSLVYNLTLKKSKRTVTAPTSREHIAAVSGILQKWDGGKRAVSDSQPSKLAVLLDHKYTEAGLTFDALKGVDRARADVLFAGAQDAGWDASLALVTYWESGSAEPSDDYGYRRRRGYWDDDSDAGEHIMGEVYDSSLTAEHFSDAEGNRLDIGEIPLHENELVSGKSLTDGEPDEEDFEGYTGNAGMTLERWYHRAAVMLWPGESRFDVLCEAGVESSVGGLDLMVRQWKQAKKSEQEKFKAECLEFAGRIIAQWPQQQFGSGSSVDYGWRKRTARNESQVPPRDLPSLLQELGDVSLISAWIRGVLASDNSIDPGKTLGDLCKQHGWATFQAELRNLFEETSNETLERNARLLADWSLRKDKNTDRIRLCWTLAQELMTAVERWEPTPMKHDWRARTVNRNELLPTVAKAFLALGEAKLLERLVTFILDRPAEFDLTAIQVPVLLGLQMWLKRNVKLASPALQRWLAAVYGELESRAARPPQEPGDWRRESDTGCNCGDCKELGRFLDNPHTETLQLKLAKGRRQHLHQIVDRNKLDTTHVTERRGSPYTLVFKKTKASYERAVKAHEVDLDHQEKIQELLEWHESLEAKPARSKARSKKTTKKGQRHE